MHSNENNTRNVFQVLINEISMTLMALDLMNQKIIMKLKLQCTTFDFIA